MQMFCKLKPNFCFTYNWKSSFSCTSKIKKNNPTGFQHHLCSLCLYGRSQTLLCLRPTLYILVLKYIVTRFSLDSSIRAVLRYCVCSDFFVFDQNYLFCFDDYTLLSSLVTKIWLQELTFVWTISVNFYIQDILLFTSIRVKEK